MSNLTWQDAAAVAPPAKAGAPPVDWPQVADATVAKIEGAIKESVRAVGGAAEYAWPRYVRAVSVEAWSAITLGLVAWLLVAAVAVWCARGANRAFARWRTAGHPANDDGDVVCYTVATAIFGVVTLILGGTLLYLAPGVCMRALEPEGAIIRDVVGGVFAGRR